MAWRSFLTRFFRAWADDLEVPEGAQEKFEVNKNAKNETMDDKDGKHDE